MNRIKKTLGLACFLCLGSVVLSPSVWAKRVNKETLDMVKFFIRTPVEKLPPDYIEGFLKVSPDELPHRLRNKFKGKRLELLTLKHLNKMKKRGFIRRVKADCEPEGGSKSTDIMSLKLAGYQEITEDEEEFLIRRTECTEMELMCEFSLAIGLEEVKIKRRRRRKGGADVEKTKTVRHLFIHGNDPLLVILDEYRSHRKERQTKFFGLGIVKCKH